MKFFVGIIFVIAAFFVQERECLLKTLSISVGYRNPNYADNTLEVFTDKWNDTANYEIFHWRVLKNFPADVALTTKVYLLDENGIKLKCLLDIVIPICVEGPYRQFLPEFLHVPRENLNQVCILKKNYYYTNVGQLDIESLIPNLGYIGKYIGSENALSSSREYIVDWVTIYETVPEQQPSHGRQPVYQPQPTPGAAYQPRPVYQNQPTPGGSYQPRPVYQNQPTPASVDESELSNAPSAQQPVTLSREYQTPPPADVILESEIEECQDD